MAIPALADHLHTRPHQLQKARESGRKIVGFFPGNYVPEEIIHASGAVPIGLIHGGNPRAAEAGLSKMPQYICPFARSLIGDQLLGRNPFFAALDLVVAPITCQHLKKVAELWEYEQTVAVFKLGVPHQYTHEFEQAYFNDRLNTLCDQMETLTGCEITRTKLVKSIELYNRMRSLLKKIGDSRRRPDPAISAGDFAALHHGSYLADPVFMVDLLETENQRLKKRPSASPPDGPRLLLLGPNLGYGDNKVVNLVEKAGGRIVVEEFCEGMRHYWNAIDTQGDLLQVLAQGYLVDRLPCAYMRDSAAKRLAFALDLIRDFKVDGVIWYELICCETYDSEGYYFAGELEKRGIPFIVLESDYGEADTGQLQTRVEAFIEIVEGGL